MQNTKNIEAGGTHELQERLNKSLRESGMKPIDVARKLGMNKSGVARWFTHKVPEKHLPVLADMFNVDLEWLATGKKLGRVTDSNSGDKQVEISVLDIDLSAGGGSTTPEFIMKKDNHTYREGFLKRLGLKAKDLRIVFVKGESMLPTIDDGDKVLVDTSKQRIIDMKIYAIVVGGDLKIKRLKRLFDGSIEIISDNQAHGTETITPEMHDYLYIIGQVVEISRVVI